MKKPLKPLEFLGSSQDDLRAMPSTALCVGGGVEVVQLGGMPSDFKPMPAVGEGAYEIRVRDAAGAFRVAYVAKRANAVYVFCTLSRRKRGKQARSILLWPSAAIN
jgi:phage-related protein